MVDRLLWKPAGTVTGADRAVTVEGARTPVERLLARRLLRPAGTDTVLLPREVAWHLRGRRFSPEPVPSTAAGGVRSDRVHPRSSTGRPSGPRTGWCTTSSWSHTPCRRHRTGCCVTVAWPSATSPASAAVLGTDHDSRLLRARVRRRRPVCWRPGTGSAAADRRLRPLGGTGARRPLARAGRGLAAHRPAPRVVQRAGRPSRSDPSRRRPARRLSAGCWPSCWPPYRSGTTWTWTTCCDVVGWHRPRLVRVGGVPLESVLAWTWREAGWLGVNSLGAVSGLASAASAADTQPAAGRAGRRVPGAPSTRSCCRRT